MRRFNRVFGTMLLGLGTVLGGCAGGDGPSRVEFSSARYQTAFDAAAEALRSRGFTPSVRDLRRGVIETDAAIFTGLLEPWQAMPASGADQIAATLATRRQRVRIDFEPLTFDPAAGDAPLPGPDLFGLNSDPDDLSAWDGPIEVRVRASVEQSRRPGIRRSTWSRALTSRTEIRETGPNGERRTRSALDWTPVDRNARLERVILADIEQVLTDSDADMESDTDPSGTVR